MSSAKQGLSVIKISQTKVLCNKPSVR